jgi:L-ribulose-5-phosphate 3-epimerase
MRDEMGGPSRRDALALLGAAPLIAASTAHAQTSPSAPARPSLPPETGAPPLTLVSRHIQWAEPARGVEIAKQAGFAGIAWTVRGGAHVESANVRRDLPPILAATQAAGLTNPMIITAIDQPNAEAESILETMRTHGIRRYRLGTGRYDLTKEIQPQYDAFRRRIEAIVRMNEKYDTVAMFHTHSGGAIGGAGWDLWMLLRDLDPRYVGINYDIGHTTVKGGSGVQEGMRAAHKHIHALSVKDFHWVKRTNVAPGQWAWRNEFVPPGEGMVNFADAFRYMKSIGFSGPLEQYFEYMVPVPGRAAPMNMLGTNYKEWQLEIPVETFLGYLKRDVDFYKAALRQAGFA